MLVTVRQTRFLFASPSFSARPWLTLLSLIQGGAAVVTDLTGANQYAISMIISLPVAIYTLVGGLRSSLLADYIHTCALFAIILTFQFTVYATSDKIGSPSRMYDLLVQAGKDWPVEGNKEGSYLTFQSRTGMIFMSAVFVLPSQV